MTTQKNEGEGTDRRPANTMRTKSALLKAATLTPLRRMQPRQSTARKDVNCAKPRRPANARPWRGPAGEERLGWRGPAWV